MSNPPNKSPPQLHLILDLGSGIAWNVPDLSKYHHAVIDLPSDAPDLPETFQIIVDHTRNILTTFEDEK